MLGSLKINGKEFAVVIMEDEAGERKSVYLENDSERDGLYRTLHTGYVRTDVRDRWEDVFEGEHFLDDEELERLINAVVNRYVYDGESDSNLSYWDNIDEIINNELANIEA